MSASAAVTRCSASSTSICSRRFTAGGQEDREGGEEGESGVWGGKGRKESTGRCVWEVG